MERNTATARMLALVTLFLAFVFVLGVYLNNRSTSYIAPPVPPPPTIDYLAYNRKMIVLANYGTTSAATGVLATSTRWTATTTSISSLKNPWPVSTVYPNFGAILPFSRVVAYYGNFNSAGMGILGEYPAPEMIDRLQSVVSEWRAADPTTPVIPALDYIAVVAQNTPGADGKYRLRMPARDIEKAISLSRGMQGLAIIDVQVGLSNLQTEIPLLESYLEEPDVELAIDPEFSMKTGARPGTVIGTMSAADINYVAEYLAGIVRQYHLPPKILIVHRFTEDMVTSYKTIKPLPEVQVVLSMDGWGPPRLKERVYADVVQDEPVQFGGIKLFYKNDVKPPSTGLLTPAEIFKLKPQPIFVEYQ